jgi:hypothetical protein
MRGIVKGVWAAAVVVGNFIGDGIQFLKGMFFLPNLAGR